MWRKRQRRRRRRRTRRSWLFGNRRRNQSRAYVVCVGRSGLDNLYREGNDMENSIAVRRSLRRLPGASCFSELPCLRESSGRLRIAVQGELPRRRDIDTRCRGCRSRDPRLESRLVTRRVDDTLSPRLLRRDTRLGCRERPANGPSESIRIAWNVT